MFGYPLTLLYSCRAELLQPATVKGFNVRNRPDKLGSNIRAERFERILTISLALAV